MTNDPDPDSGHGEVGAGRTVAGGSAGADTEPTPAGARDQGRRRVGLLGGTFDPIHLGHLVIGEYVRDRLGLDELRLLVAGDPWMKDSESAAHHRVAMARAAVADHDAIVVDDRETRRNGPTYTADTLAMLHDEEPGTDFQFLLGADAAAHLPDWHRVTEALALATFVVVGRPGSERPTHDLMDGTNWVEAPLVDISSTQVRADVAAGHSVRYRVPDLVRAYLDDHHLYRPTS